MWVLWEGSLMRVDSATRSFFSLLPDAWNADVVTGASGAILCFEAITYVLDGSEERRNFGPR